MHLVGSKNRSEEITGKGPDRESVSVCGQGRASAGTFGEYYRIRMDPLEGGDASKKDRRSHSKLGLMLKFKPLRPPNGPCVQALGWACLSPIHDLISWCVTSATATVLGSPQGIGKAVVGETY